MITNPLPVGRYRVDLWTPTASAPAVRDGVPVFNRWREANAARVRVLHAQTWNTSPRRTSVLFEVQQRPGAWPFGQLGQPIADGAEVGAVTAADAVAFLFDPLGALEGTATQAAARFLGEGFAEFAAPELRELRAAISVTKADIAVIRATLEAVRNHTAPDPHAAIAAAKALARQCSDLLTHALAGIAIDFPRRAVSQLIADLHALERAIEDAPAKALRALGQAAKDVAIPFEAANLGALAFGAAALWALYNRKSTDATTTVMVLGAAALLLGGSTLVDNLAHPFEHAGKAARDLKGT